VEPAGISASGCWVVVVDHDVGDSLWLDRSEVAALTGEVATLVALLGSLGRPEQVQASLSSGRSRNTPSW
jgi:hypothetical protein